MAYTPPTDEQLERFIHVSMDAEARRRGLSGVVGAHAATMAMNFPEMKDAWIERHRKLQEAADALASERKS